VDPHYVRGLAGSENVFVYCTKDVVYMKCLMIHLEKTANMASFHYRKSPGGK